jgi:hypothetical protein
MWLMSANAQQAIGGLSARLNAALGRESGLRERLQIAEEMLTQQQELAQQQQHLQQSPRQGPRPEGQQQGGADLAAAEKIAMLEASLQACYLQLEHMRCAAAAAATLASHHALPPSSGKPSHAPPGCTPASACNRTLAPAMACAPSHTCWACAPAWRMPGMP